MKEQDKDRLVWRDKRPIKDVMNELSGKLRDGLYDAVESRRTILATIAACAAGTIIAPHAAMLFAPLGLAATAAHRFIRRPAPAIDPKGIMFMGHDKVTGKEIWFNSDQVRQHMLVLGTTGTGKTEGLLGLAENPLSWGSGFIFVDGKGDVALLTKIYRLARLYGREDDILVLNAMSANADHKQWGEEIPSNTLNPFADGTPDGLTQMVVSLMDGSGSDAEQWKGRGTTMLTGLMRALTWLRDHGQLDLNIGSIRDYLSLKSIIDLTSSEKHPEMPKEIRHAIERYLSSLPSYDAERGYRQPQSVIDQHGYLEMVFTRILGSLADTYGHIFFTDAGEIDMNDVVLNRRILVVCLPALEKSDESGANIGKMVVAALKGMMGRTLGSGIQGSWEQIVESRPTRSASPFQIYLDEVNHYMIEGMALMSACSRALGFGLVLGSEDIPALKQKNPKEAGSVIANTNTKIFMRHDESEASIGGAARMHANKMPRGSADLDDVGLGIQEAVLPPTKAGEMVLTHQDDVIQGIIPFATATDLSRPPLYTPNHFIALRSERPTKRDL